MMRMDLKRVPVSFLVVLSLFLYVRGLSASGSGTTGADFLKLNPGSMSGAMGGSGMSLSLGAESVWLNPSALGFSDRLHETLFSHSFWWQGCKLEHAAYLLSLSQSDTIGASFTYFHMPSLEETDIWGDPTGTILDIYDMSAGFTYVKKLMERLSAGGNVKYVSRKLGPATASAFAADMGATYRLSGNSWSARALYASFLVKNLGTSVKFLSAESPLPSSARAGLGYKMEKLAFALDLEKPFDNSLKYRAGCEAYLGKNFPVRAGYESSDDLGRYSGLTFGVGIYPAKTEYSSWGSSGSPVTYYIDYAVRHCGDLGLIHRICVKLSFITPD